MVQNRFLAAFFGDSIVWGQGLPEEDKFSTGLGPMAEPVFTPTYTLLSLFRRIPELSSAPVTSPTTRTVTPRHRMPTLPSGGRSPRSTKPTQ